MWKDFKAFALKGNVIDLAIGVIIGGAFGKIISSLVSDLIMPLIGLITGDINYSNMFILLKPAPQGVVINTLDDAVKYKLPTLNYGSFLTQVIDFLIVALTIFLVIRLITKFTKAAERVVHKGKGEEETPSTKKCPYCKTEIDFEATRCPHCTSVLEDKE